MRMKYTRGKRDLCFKVTDQRDVFISLGLVVNYRYSVPTSFATASNQAGVIPIHHMASPYDTLLS